MFIDLGLVKLIYLLETRLNLRLDPNEETVTVQPNEDDAIPCVAPHPARGSDTHRIVAVLVSHSDPLKLDEIIDERRRDALQSIPFYKDRVVNLKRLISIGDVSIESYQFFRTCWTIHTSKVYARLGTCSRQSLH